jgi:cytochrome c oxidase cbb3-type subunit I/II
LTFGRLRPLHTNAAIFAFAGNAIFAAIYYSTQRLCKARMFSDTLSRLHFWGWQLIIVCAAMTLPLGITQSKEYAELEWPIDLLIAVVWVASSREFLRHAGPAARTSPVRRAVVLHRDDRDRRRAAHVQQPRRPDGAVQELLGLRGRAGRLHAVVVRAQRRGVLPDHAVPGADVLLLPKAANRPVFSYRLSIIHFWSLVFIYIWAGPHHLHYTALPAWASTLGMLFSLMLWMPSLGRHDQRPAHAARRVAQGRRRPRAQVLRRRHHVLRHEHVRRPDALHQERSTPWRTTPTGSSATCTAARSAGTGS